MHVDDRICPGYKKGFPRVGLARQCSPGEKGRVNKDERSLRARDERKLLSADAAAARLGRQVREAGYAPCRDVAGYMGGEEVPPFTPRFPVMAARIARLRFVWVELISCSVPTR